MKHQTFSIKMRIRSFGFAINGLKILFHDEHNSIIHLLASACAIAAGFILNITLNEWTMITFSIGLVFSLEIINSSIERIADFVSPQKHDTIKKVKDLAAAGVLIGSIAALIIGLIVFTPKILKL